MLTKVKNNHDFILAHTLSKSIIDVNWERHPRDGSHRLLAVCILPLTEITQLLTVFLYGNTQSAETRSAIQRETRHS